MSHLVAAFQLDDFLADFVLENMMDHPLCVEVGKLNWECFEGVAFRDVVLDACLELVVCKSLAA